MSEFFDTAVSITDPGVIDNATGRWCDECHQRYDVLYVRDDGTVRCTRVGDCRLEVPHTADPALAKTVVVHGPAGGSCRYCVWNLRHGHQGSKSYATWYGSVTRFPTQLFARPPLAVPFPEVA